MTKGRVVLLSSAAILAAGAIVLFQQLPTLAAGGLLYPSRHTATADRPPNCSDRELAGEGVMLRGWACSATTPRLGTIAYLHGDDVSPVKAASSVRIPVLLIHGAKDVDTVPSHSERVVSALRGPTRLILVEGAGHNHSLSDAKVWTDIDQWIESVLRTSREGATRY